MVSRIHPLWLAPLMILLMILCAGAGLPYSQVTIDADTDKKQVHVGESLRLKVMIVQAAASQSGVVESNVTPELPNLPGFTVYASESSQNINIINNVMQQKVVQEYRLQADAAGTQTIPPIAYLYTDPQTRRPIQLATKPIKIEVLPAESGGPAAWWLWVVGVGLMGAGALAYVSTNRKRSKAGAPVAEVLDAGESAEIKRLRFFLDGHQVESFYGAVSDAVRLALERSYGIPAQAQTSGELVLLLRAQQVPEDTVELVRKCLERCDLAKFAGYSSSAAEMEQVFQEVYDLLESATRPSSTISA